MEGKGGEVQKCIQRSSSVSVWPIYNPIKRIKATFFLHVEVANVCVCSEDFGFNDLG